MTHKQIRHYINQQLNVVWRTGDRDECSIKHTGYGLIALAFDRPWTDAIDYERPWPWPDDPAWAMKKINRAWGKIAELRENVGHEAWDAAVRDSDFGWYYEARMDTAMKYYGIPSDDPTMQRSIDAMARRSADRLRTRTPDAEVTA